MQSAVVSGQERVLVTGANRGIGLEVVKSILEDEAKGRTVFLGCRDMQAGEELAEKLCQTYGQQVVAVHLEVTSAESVAKAVEKIGADGQHLDVLVNNAGILLDGDCKQFDAAAMHETMRVNFEGVVTVTTAFLPLLLKAPGGQVLSTSSGNGPRAMGLLSNEHRQALMDPNLDENQLLAVFGELVTGLLDPSNSYHSIPQVSYGFSKMGVNCLTQLWARKYPTLRVNACSPGFCNTDMCANYTGQRKPKDPALGASVFKKVLFEELGKGRSGTFFKEASKTGAPLDQAVSCIDPWVAFPEQSGGA